jgi:methyl-accepting chemotaxis protein
LESGRNLAEKSMELVEGINNSMVEINTSVVQIASSIEEQNSAIEEFTDGIGDLSNESKFLEDYCKNTSEILFKSVRNIDKVRGRITRFSLGLGLKESLSLFKTDHIMYVYRFYNMLLGFEELTVSGMGDPTKCKLGVWYTTSADENLKNTNDFIMLGNHHNELQRTGVNCINAYSAGDIETAENEYMTASPAASVSR